jgi:large conductance mechanosensitive channel
MQRNRPGAPYKQICAQHGVTSVDRFIVVQGGIGVLEEFKAFALRGNVVDLAIAVILGGAFAKVIDSLVADIIMPIIGIFGGSPDFTANKFSINGSEFGWGNFVTVVIAFIIVALVLFFVVVKPMTAMMKKAGLVPPPAE